MCSPPQSNSVQRVEKLCPPPKHSKVRFRDSSTVVFRPSMSKEERNATWWSKRELKTIKREVQAICRELRAMGSYTSACLDDAYNDADVRALSFSWNEDKDVSQFSAIDAQKGLVKWCTYGHSKRGLERWSSQKHDKARERDIQSARSAVLSEQKFQKTLSKTGLIDNESLAKVAMASSKKSRVFARLLGAADADAVVYHTEKTFSVQFSVNSSYEIRSEVFENNQITSTDFLGLFNQNQKQSENKPY